MKSPLLVTLVSLSLATAAVAGGRNPGSALIYPVQRSGPDFFTVISLSNTNTMPMTPMSFGGSTVVHYQYANMVPNTDPLDPDAPFRPLNCVVFNRRELLTPADHLSVVTSCHNATSPGGQEGFLAVSAENPNAFASKWCHDFLVGSELVINAAGGIYSINAIPFNWEDTEGVFSGGAEELALNGILYEQVPDELIINFYCLAGSQLTLINLGGSPTDINTVQFTIWNDNEFALSATRTFNCWFDQPLGLVSPVFAEDFFRDATPHDPEEMAVSCDGSVKIETGWAKIDSIDVSTPGGLPVSDDGALLGAITTGPDSLVDGGRLPWESDATQPGFLFAP